MSLYGKADQDVATLKQAIGKEVQKKLGASLKPKNEAEAKSMQKKIDAEIQKGVTARKAQFDKIESTLNNGVSAIMVKKYQANLRALMGKPFVPAKQGK
jgi:ribosomal protein S3